MRRASRHTLAALTRQTLAMQRQGRSADAHDPRSVRCDSEAETARTTSRARQSGTAITRDRVTHQRAASTTPALHLQRAAHVPVL
ncbi:hypothetical protein XFF6991_390102 [Xanthomonas phaseoli pv. phaseoli]|uniref:Uncharacterized protein n=1 Tax=Xanthomonas campestris pv. phaseoli TaxID=317013 RepID=A0A7Z7IZU2_XANCH|nr:hypothetical protein XFF6991_390102 [Xanthomonas phaseoli pv. phaseoli]